MKNEESKWKGDLTTAVQVEVQFAITEWKKEKELRERYDELAKETQRQMDEYYGWIDEVCKDIPKVVMPEPIIEETLCKISNTYGHPSINRVNENPEVKPCNSHIGIGGLGVKLGDRKYYPLTSEIGASRCSGHGESSPSYCFLYAETYLGRVKLEGDKEYLIKKL